MLCKYSSRLLWTFKRVVNRKKQTELLRVSCLVNLILLAPSSRVRFVG